MLIHFSNSLPQCLNALLPLLLLQTHILDLHFPFFAKSDGAQQHAAEGNAVLNRVKATRWALFDEVKIPFMQLQGNGRIDHMHLFALVEITAIIQRVRLRCTVLVDDADRIARG